MIKLYSAPFSRRILAAIIDYFALSTVIYIIVIAFAIISSVIDLGSDAEAVVLVLAVLLALFILPICEIIGNGRTLGKLAMGLRVVCADGTPASATQSLQRYLMLPFDVLFSFGIVAWLSATLTSKRQRLGDLLAGTMVAYDSAHSQIYNDVANIYYNGLDDECRDIFGRVETSKSSSPMTLAQIYRGIQCDLSRLRTIKAHPLLIDYTQRVLANVHLRLFRRRVSTWRDTLATALRGVPRAVYESRYCVITSLVIAMLSIAIGAYSQAVDPAFFENILGTSYTQTTLDNIEAGKPMGIYDSDSEVSMFFSIFLNNFLVTLRLYVFGIFILVGPVIILIENFVMVGTFETFFAQHGLLAMAVTTINEHGVLELCSIIMAGGASIRLGTGWLFPGRFTRLQALTRSARQSLLIMLSTVPMLFVAAFIEGFVTRHVEWPMAVKLSIIIVSLIIIIGYYVMLPVISRRY